MKKLEGSVLSINIRKGKGKMFLLNDIIALVILCDGLLAAKSSASSSSSLKATRFFFDC